jgi:hypothetical protein
MIEVIEIENGVAEAPGSKAIESTMNEVVEAFEIRQMVLP